MEVLKNSLNGSKIERVLVANSEKQPRVYQNSMGVSKETPLIKITGVLTSPLQLRGERSETESAKQGTKEPYHYAFVKLKGQTVDLPVIFKIKGELSLKRSELIELLGNYSNSTKSIRKSFTAYAYQILNEKRIKKKCVGCLDDFACSTQENYDYCPKETK